MPDSQDSVVGKAEIITENRSIFNRIFEKVMNRINRRQAGV
ncbi:hypothetical protein [Chitinophaga solisilvae]|nr:hypothetical protein [Chitinophaga solisilvae]